MLAWRDEPLLVESVHAVLASRDLEVDVVLVDNGCTSDAVERLTDVPGVSVVAPGANLGFAGGCNLGARHATGEFLAFVNGDAVKKPKGFLQYTKVAETSWAWGSIGYLVTGVSGDWAAANKSDVLIDTVTVPG